MSEILNEPLYWPGGGVSQSADGVSFNLPSDFLKHVNFCKVGVSHLHSLQHVNQPGGSLSAGSALAATLVSVKMGKSEDGINNVSLIVHHDNGSGS